MSKYNTPDALWASVIPCEDHPMGVEFAPNEWAGCDGCQAEQTARSAVIDQMQAEASERVAGLAQQGAQMPPWVMLEARIDVLLDTVFRDPRNRTLYEGEVGRRIMLSVLDMQRQMREPQKPVLHVARGNQGIPNLRDLK